MSTQRSLAFLNASPAGSTEIQARLLRILLIGPELRVEELQTLLAGQEDMALLPTSADLESALDVLSRLNGTTQIDVALIELESSEKKHVQLLQMLSRRLPCLIISPPLAPGEARRLEEAGVAGYCSSAASSQQLFKAIRTVARGGRYFRPMPLSEPHQPLPVRRRPVFFRDRLEECASGWRLSEIELLILAHFDAASSDEIARRIHKSRGTVRNTISGVFIFLQHISERNDIPNRMVGFEVLLELGIFEYR
jgi:DNA-binding NarL/FixJ family response regulator